MRYKQLHDGEWFAPNPKNHKVKCCDCGLIHRYEYKIVKKGKKNIIMYRAFRVVNK